MEDTFAMQQNAMYQKIGHFVVMFQQAEERLNELLILMADIGEEVVMILTNELEYSDRLKTTDVMFNHFLELRSSPDAEAKQEFHDLTVELRKLGEIRNGIVHSHYMPFVNIKGVAGLRRTNSKLASKKGRRDVKEVDLLPESFDEDLERLAVAHQSLEKFRLKVIHMMNSTE